MSLPKITQPKFNIEIPSTGKKTTFVPFTVKEEKILLIAKESKDIDQAILSVKQIITNCVDDVDVDKLSMFDIEYLLINLRAKSVSDLMEFTIKDPETEEEVELSINIADIKVIKNPDHKKTIELRDGIYLGMKYPQFDQLKDVIEAEEHEKTARLFDMMMDCIESVVQGDDVYMLKDFTDKEVSEFIDGLTSKDINKIKEFFDTMPKLRYEQKYKRTDGVEKTFVAEGTETFFI